MAERFVKIGADGKRLAQKAANWPVVLDDNRGLYWSVDESKRMNFKQASAWVKKLRLGGFKDWRLPTVEELFLLADRSRHSPAIDTDFFPKCASDYYWTATPAAISPADYAWLVAFDSGYSYWNPRCIEYFVRAVRSSQ